MKNLHIKGAFVAKDNGDVEGIASTPQPDRHNDAIVQEGWDYKEYEQTNPVLLLNHKQDSLPIGKITKIGIIDGDLKFKAVFSKATQEAREAYELVKEGILNTFSVGFAIKEEQEDAKSGINFITKAELYEISLVTVPANPGAVVTAKSMKDNTLAKDIAEDAEHEHEMVEIEKWSDCTAQVLKCECGEESSAWEKTAESKNLNNASEDEQSSNADKKAKNKVDKGRIKNVKLAVGDLQAFLSEKKKGTEDVKSSVTLLQRYLKLNKNKLN